MGDDDLEDQVDALGMHVDNLEKLLEPITSAPITETAQKLPILDQAKLNVLAAYAANSLIFATLKLQGQDPREHPVWDQLARTRTYFEKIKAAEEKGAAPLEQQQQQQRSRLDVAAAGRFIKAGLAGNDRVGDEARAGAKRKLDALDAALNGSNPNSGNDDEADATPKPLSKKARKKARRAQRLAEAAMGSDPEPAEPAEPVENPASDNAPTQSGGTDEIRGNQSDGKSPKKKEKKKRSEKAPRDSKEVMKDLLKKGGEKKKKNLGE